MPNGKFVREIGKNLYAWAFAPHGAHRQGRQHLGHRQGLGHDRQVQPQGRVMMVFGRKSEASDAEAHPHERNAGEAAAA